MEPVAHHLPRQVQAALQSPALAAMTPVPLQVAVQLIPGEEKLKPRKQNETLVHQLLKLTGD